MFPQNMETQFIGLLCVCVCYSKSLLVHLWHSSAALPDFLSSDWLHHGLANEGVWGCGDSWGRKKVKVEKEKEWNV